jgi:hypothetical protein
MGDKDEAFEGWFGAIETYRELRQMAFNCGWDAHAENVAPLLAVCDELIQAWDNQADISGHFTRFRKAVEAARRKYES